MAMFEHNTNKYSKGQQQSQGELESLHNFGLAEFESLFLFYLACNTLAFVVLFVQCFQYHRAMRKARHQH